MATLWKCDVWKLTWKSREVHKQVNTFYALSVRGYNLKISNIKLYNWFGLVIDGCPSEVQWLLQKLGARRAVPVSATTRVSGGLLMAGCQGPVKSRKVVSVPQVLDTWCQLDHTFFLLFGLSLSLSPVSYSLKKSTGNQKWFRFWLRSLCIFITSWNCVNSGDGCRREVSPILSFTCRRISHSNIEK